MWSDIKKGFGLGVGAGIGWSIGQWVAKMAKRIVVLLLAGGLAFCGVAIDSVTGGKNHQVQQKN